MAIRTVRLDEESERLLRDLQRTTGESVSTVLKRGLIALRDLTRGEVATNPYQVYAQLDVGPGGYARAPASKAKQHIREVLQRRQGHR